MLKQNGNCKTSGLNKILLILLTVSCSLLTVEAQWVQRYNGPGNFEDNARSIAVDGSGNVYVTGSSYVSGTEQNYTTIKYNSSGDTLWVARYNGPGGSDGASSIAIDGSGNVYVTGGSEGSGTGHDYASIKYNSSGVQQWVSRYSGPGNGYDWASSIAVDGSGNVYVTGSIRIGTREDYATIKYNSSGDSLWVRRYNGLGDFWDEAYSLAVDGSGNVYVTGKSFESETDYDYATIKYNSLGDSVWVRRYNGPGNAVDNAYSIAVDGSGNVYVTGDSYGSGTSEDYATIKYNSTGVQQWVRRYNGPGNFYDNANSLAVDGSGNVYVTGGSIGTSFPDYDYATIKYNSTGDIQWVTRYNGPANDRDGASSIALDGAGNVYVTGWSTGSGTYYDYATLKYDSSGVQQWVQRYNGPGNVDDFASSLAVDGSGNVFVTGRSGGTGTGWDYATIEYSHLVGITPISNEIPETFRLEQNYPNPFNPTTHFGFRIADFGFVRLIIYDVLGREITALVNEQLNAGTYEVDWNASNYPSGVYYYKIIAGDYTDTKKMILIK